MSDANARTITRRRRMKASLRCALVLPTHRCRLRNVERAEDRQKKWKDRFEPERYIRNHLPVTRPRAPRLQGDRLDQHRWIRARNPARRENSVDPGDAICRYVGLGGDGSGPDSLANRSSGELLREPRTGQLDNAEHHEEQEQNGEDRLHDRRPLLRRKPPRPFHCPTVPRKSEDR